MILLITLLLALILIMIISIPGKKENLKLLINKKKMICLVILVKL